MEMRPDELVPTKLYDRLAVSPQPEEHVDPFGNDWSEVAAGGKESQADYEATATAAFGYPELTLDGQGIQFSPDNVAGSGLLSFRIHQTSYGEEADFFRRTLGDPELIDGQAPEEFSRS